MRKKRLLSKTISFVSVASLFSVSLSAETVLPLVEGWNLIGFNKNYSFEEIYKSAVINTIYGYQNGKWVKNGSVSPSEGIWAYSPKGGNFYFDTDSSKQPEISKIDLHKGWNLVSIPINSTLSPDIFKDQPIVWKYSNNEWHKYRKDGKFTEYPQIDFLGKGEGFWVYSDDNLSIDLSNAEAKLRTFSSAEAMKDYLLAMVKYNFAGYRNYPMPYFRAGIMDDVAVNAPTVDKGESTSNGESNSADKVSDTTTTNVQEIGVDEADIVKHDGDKIFYLSGNWSDNEILVSTFDRIMNGEKKPLTTIKTEGKPDELYLINNKLIAVYPYNNGFWNSWKSDSDQMWRESSLVEIYDVSDLNKISKINSFKFSGNIVDSRITNNKLFIVSRFMPSINVSYPKDYESCKIETTSINQAMIGKIAPDYYYGYNGCWYNDENGLYTVDYSKPIYGESDLIPTLNDQALISEENLYAPLKIDQSPFVTSITSFELNNTNFTHESVSVIGNSETIYSSTEALYFVSSSYPLYYNWENYKERVAIYKFGIKNKLSYNGMGYVDGHILNQFSLSEFDGKLRLATTEGWSSSWWNREKDGTDNIISVLDEVNNSLSTIGEIRGLGKANESIRGVRFFGNRGYIVTFLQKDPLYVVDLSNPNSPKLGENPLEINGYSTYFHPVSSNRVLSLGVNADGNGSELGYQIQLFDVADFNNPKLIDKRLIPENQTISTRWQFSSDAIYDHKAFTYRATDNLFGLPLQETFTTEMNDSAKAEYKQTYYVQLTLNNYKNYSLYEPESIKKRLEANETIYANSLIETYKQDGNSSSVNPNLPSALAYYHGYFYSESELYYPTYYGYKNTFQIYGVENNLSTIEWKSYIDGGSNESYNYQRGIIFSTGEGTKKRNFGLLLSGGELFIDEIK